MKYKKYTQEEIIEIAHTCCSLDEFSKKISFSIRQRNIKEFNDYFHIDLKNIIETNNRIRKLKDELYFLEHLEICDKCGRTYRNGDRIRENKSKHHFCSDLCSKQYSADFAHTDEIKRIVSEKLKIKTHIIHCDRCGKNIECSINKSFVICDDCLEIMENDSSNKEILDKYFASKSNRKQKKCKICGRRVGDCKRPEICSSFRVFPRLIKYLSFDESTLGSEEAYKEYDRVKKYVYDLYWNQNMSIREIKELCGYEYSDGDFGSLLKHFIDFRKVREGVKNAIRKGVKVLPCNINSAYKSGYHTTWENKKVFYRSSYELDYCKELDSNKIPYDMEAIRLKYYDTQKDSERVAIPDFLLMNENKIVEVKSKFTYNKQNMIDKVKVYRENGYKFTLIYEHKTYNEDEFLSIEGITNNSYQLEMESYKGNWHPSDLENPDT